MDFQTTTLYAGFARCDITPEQPNMPLGGYGAVLLRRHTNVLDRLYAHVLVLGHKDKPELVMITQDLSGCVADQLVPLRKEVSALTGIPEGQILCGGTHTHSSFVVTANCDESRNELPRLNHTIAKAVVEAIADLKPATVSYGNIEVGRPGSRLNFCRHYMLGLNADYPNYSQGNIVYCGDNFNHEKSSDKTNYRFLGHAQDVDPMLQVIRLSREEADDIIMVNFQAHAHITGGSKKTDMSSDFPGATVNAVEKILPGTKCIYYNGACGNINPNTRMIEDGIPGLTFGPNRNHYGYASVLADYVRICCKHLTESKTDTLKFTKAIMTLNHDHSMDHRAADAEKVSKEFLKNGATPEVKALWQSLGFNSPYQCNAIAAKAERSLTGEVELNAMQIGDVGFTTSLGEFFDDLGRYVKAKSPYPMTFFKGYSCGTGTYFPSKGSPEDTYERNVTRFAPGSGEILAEKLVSMLEELNQQ